MKTSSVLNTSERRFLALVSEATFANPFSADRATADLTISGLVPGTPPDQILKGTVAGVRDFLQKLEAAQKYDISRCAAQDLPLLTAAHLFDVFHRYVPRFDQLIQKQIKKADETVEVTFAQEAIANLIQRGFARSDAINYFAVFYQMRRAFFFINVAIRGNSPCMRDLRLSLWNNVFTCNIQLYHRYLWNRMEDFTTLLLGATGTGKGTSASAIGRSGFIPFDDRRNVFAESFMRSFISINLSQYHENLIESELFGHRKGAFTGAVEAHEGVFQLCSPHGAIFLDEIGDVSIPIQIKLLQVLQERVFHPVGSHAPQRFHGRVIAATNRALQELRERQLLRDDFFYRLCSDIIVVPTLRQRLDELPAELDELLGVVIERIVGTHSNELVELVHGAIRRDLGEDYAWPGNVRELEQCVRRTLLTGRYRGNAVERSSGLHESIVQRMQAGDYAAEELVSDYCRLLYKRHGTYEEVARRSRLDRRTVKKYITRQKGSS